MAGVTHHYDSTDGVRIGYREWPAMVSSIGETILFLHGLGAKGSQFEADAAHFASLGYAVIVPDLRGHGLSTRPRSLKRDTMNVATLARDLLPLIDRITKGPQGGPLHLVGNSLGGLVALALCGLRGKTVTSLCTFGTTYRLAYPVGVAGLQFVLSRMIGLRRLADMVAKQATQVPTTRPVLRDMFSKADPRVIYQVQQNIHAYDRREAARRYPGPILFLSGQHDKAINRHAASTLSALQDKPGFRHVEISGAGHFANLDRPDIFRSDLGNFLATVAAQNVLDTNMP